MQSNSAHGPTHQSPSVSTSAAVSEINEQPLTLPIAMAMPPQSVIKNYNKLVRPIQGELLSLFRLDRSYVAGTGDWLVAKGIDGQPDEMILDLVGGYGANLLGHNHPQVRQASMDFYQGQGVNHLQGAVRSSAAILAEKINEILNLEKSCLEKTKQPSSHQQYWISHFSNSGTEAIEAALKICFMSYEEKKNIWASNFLFEKNKILKLLKNSPQNLKTFISDLSNQLSSELIKNSFNHLELIQLESFLEDQALIPFIEYYTALMAQHLNHPLEFLAVEGCFHGKTLGSLSLTYNPAFKHHFGKGPQHYSVSYCPLNDTEQLEYLFKKSQRNIPSIEIDRKTGGLKLGIKQFNPIAACFVEPIQGEGGIRELSIEFLNSVKKNCNFYKTLLVSDEIQAGFYRTGSFAALHQQGVTADVYCFSKSLGAGVAKIATTVTASSCYPHSFAMLHTSTFAEDHFSCTIALTAIKLAQEQLQTYPLMHLKLDLLMLQQDFPDLIAEIKGRGHLLGLELSTSWKNISNEFALLCQSNYLGYFLSSVLLNREKIRILPTLSAPLTLRISPSIYLTDQDRIYLIQGLRNFFQAAKNLQHHYFWNYFKPDNSAPPDIMNLNSSVVLGQQQQAASNLVQNSLERLSPDLPLVGFFCHFIDNEHRKAVLNRSDIIDEHHWTPLLQRLPFGAFHRQVIRAADGKQVELWLMGHVMTSKEITKLISTNRAQVVVDHLQEGIELLKSLGATSIGLGQYTSIISKNGMSLDAKGLNITTGNAYTAALTVEAAKTNYEKHTGKLIKEARLAVIGAVGNIMSAATALLAEDVCQINLYYHTPWKESMKWRLALHQLISEIINAQLNNFLTEKIKNLLQQFAAKVTSRVASKSHGSVNQSEQLNLQQIFDNNTESFIDLLHSEQLISCYVLDDQSVMNIEGDLVITGTSSAGPFLTAEQFETGSVLVDVGVPNNVKLDSLISLDGVKKNLFYTAGGLARLPLGPGGGLQFIDSPLLRLNPGDSYACLSETLMMGLQVNETCSHLGDIDKAMIKETLRWQKNTGFKIASKLS